MATHKELITAGKFDEKFKRALLDYFNDSKVKRILAQTGYHPLSETVDTDIRKRGLLKNMRFLKYDCTFRCVY